MSDLEPVAQSNTTLRRVLRQQRRCLPYPTRRKAAKQVARRMVALPAFTKAKRIGIYLDAFGEVPTGDIICMARASGKMVYVPNILPSRHAMRFARLRIHPKNTRIHKHALGMKAVHATRHIGVTKLDALIMPLVAADTYGNRMGMGGGFYDRTLSKTTNKPIRIGLAYDFQVVKKLHIEPWDMPLDYLLTPSKLWRF